MAKILFNNQIVNNLYQITISLLPGSLSQSDSNLIAEFGEPLIQVGSTILVPPTSPSGSMAVQQYITGQPTLLSVAIAGSFPSLGTTLTAQTPLNALSYVIPSQFIHLISDLPYTVSFDATNTVFSNPVVQASAWSTQIQGFYTAAFATLRANTNTWVSQTIQNI